MFKGFYNLTSSMLTHQQNLNVIANNMVNISTAGYKQDLYTDRRLEDRAISAPPVGFTLTIHKEYWSPRG